MCPTSLLMFSALPLRFAPLSLNPKPSRPSSSAFRLYTSPYPKSSFPPFLYLLLLLPPPPYPCPFTYPSLPRSTPPLFLSSTPLLSFSPIRSYFFLSFYIIPLLNICFPFFPFLFLSRFFFSTFLFSFFCLFLYLRSTHFLLLPLYI